jgi:hypothetical protein
MISTDILKTSAMVKYEVRPRKDRRGVDLISDTLPFGPSVVFAFTMKRAT